MQGFYRSAALVLRIGDRLLQRFEEQIEGEAAPLADADEAFELRRGYLAAREPDWPRDACRHVRVVRGVGRARRRSAACIRRRRARWPSRCRACRPSSSAEPALRERFLRCCAARSRCKRWSAWRAWACWGAGFRRSRKCPGACSSTCSMSTPSTSTRWRCCGTWRRFASGIADERFTHRARGLAAPAQAGAAAAGRPVPRHRQGPRRRPFRTGRRGRARILLRRHRPVRRPTPRWWNGWCASTC